LKYAPKGTHAYVPKNRKESECIRTGEYQIEKSRKVRIGQKMDIYGKMERVMFMEELTKLYETKQFEQYVKYLEEKSDPREASKLWINWCNDRLGNNESDWDAYFDSFTEEQCSRLNHLCDSEKLHNYLMSKPEDKLTDEDWADLRASDF
jgi:hypothetical protein